ncbi:MAG: PEGA domain-containing protein [Myxococcota bacterium]|nr:PEGA domain-containing protein [Myxococcota bacterium]
MKGSHLGTILHRLTALACATMMTGIGLPVVGLGTAFAADGPTIAVIGVHGNGSQDAASLSRMTDDLVAGFMLSRFSPLYGDELSGRLETIRDSLPERIFLEPIRKAVDEGRNRYQQAQPDVAVRVLQQAAEDLKGREQFLRSPSLPVELHLLLGLAQLSLGQRSDAEAAFGEVVRIDPNRVLDSLNYPPKVVEAFDQVRSRILSRPSASVFIRVLHDDPGARAYVDGRLVGTTPITARRLPPGKHLVVIDGGVRGRYSTTVTLQAGEQLDLIEDLKPATLAIPGEAFQDTRSQAGKALYREIGMATGADLVSVASFDAEGDFHLALYSVRSQNFSVQASASLAPAPGAQSAFVRQLVERVARYADERGNIHSDLISVKGVPIRVGANTILDGLLWPRPEAPSSGVEGPTELVVEKKRRSTPPPKVLGVIAAVIGGSLAATGIGLGVHFSTQENLGESNGVLVVTIP